MRKLDYRYDIDSLRAIAVFSVVFFHLGILDSGYLGVDVFFTISGFLITRILYNQEQSGWSFLLSFYTRRVRRILPLVLFFCILSLLIGCVVMLPDDLENLSQSIVATMFFGNNLLLYITTGNYWEVINEFKPLMHTWSLGIEEQFYLLYPLLFLFFGRKKNLLLAAISIVSIFSFLLYICTESLPFRFYMLPFRFYELGFGGALALIPTTKYRCFEFRSISLFLLIFTLFFSSSFAEVCRIPCIVVFTGILLLQKPEYRNKLNLLNNKVLFFLGKISFSLYMWHQVLLSFYRYTFNQHLSAYDHVFFLIILLLLSVITYKLIEQPFRNKSFIKTNRFLYGIVIVSIVIVSASIVIYLRAGVIRNVPELNIDKNRFFRNMHSEYVMNVYRLDREFSNQDDKKKVLVVGDSFARDWVNVLNESNFHYNLDIVCVNSLSGNKNKALADLAEIIFYARISYKGNSKLRKSNSSKWMDETSIKKKLYCVGTKNFGISNGVFYNYRGVNFCGQSTLMEEGYFEENIELKLAWKDRYIDIINLLINSENKVKIYTPECKFISHDTRHLTKPGAKYIADLLNFQLKEIL